MEILREKAEKDGPLCVGLDTSPLYIPKPLIKILGGEAEAVLEYNKEIVRRLASDGSASCCKIQIAYYEAMGLEGLRVYAETIRAVKDAGLTVISDVKRGDIADTARAYARAHFSGDFESDIITVNPYMGFDTLTPFTDFCKPPEGKGIFVLLRTSNPGMNDIENQTLQDGSLVLEKVGGELEKIRSSFQSLYPECVCPPVGAVVGCTEEADAKKLRDEHPEIFFLIPGYGAQGGAAKIAATLLLKAGGVVNSSRGILCAWQKDAELSEKMESGTLCLKEIADSAAKAALFAKNDLLSAKAALEK